jgi:hypothetical protein
MLKKKQYPEWITHQNNPPLQRKMSRINIYPQKTLKILLPATEEELNRELFPIP